MDTSYIPRACSVYCEGSILKYVQLAAIYNDSKTFVDMPMIYEPQETINAFNQIPDPTNENALKSFLNSYFLPAGSDLVTWIPTDFNSQPKILDQMPDDYPYKQWTSDLNQLWKVLGRNISQAVATNPEKHSFLPRRHPMIVPGGRFRESYYWDSYWIIRGLLVCNMNESAYNVIANLLDDVDNFGFVPNGGRVYYLDRSQPPMLSDMVLTYIQYSQQTNQGKISTSLQSFINTAYPLLVKEYKWWMNHGNGHSVYLPNPNTGGMYTLNRYHSNYTTPRPESYLPDYENYRASGNNSRFYPNVRAGAETGWDFSSRWLTNHYNITTIDTTEIVPVELNSILYRYEQNMQLLEAQYVPSELQVNVEINFTAAALDRAAAISTYLWDEQSYHWRDYNITSHAQMTHFPVQTNGKAYATIAYWLPLWAGLQPPTTGTNGGSQKFFDSTGESRLRGMQSMGITSSVANKLVYSLQTSGLVREGGIATTSLMTNQQWDSPNAWAPLVLMTIEGLRSLNTSYALSLAVRSILHLYLF
jgi:alpha,alpha-trehalase